MAYKLGIPFEHIAPKTSFDQAGLKNSVISKNKWDSKLVGYVDRQQTEPSELISGELFQRPICTSPEFILIVVIIIVTILAISFVCIALVRNCLRKRTMLQPGKQVRTEGLIHSSKDITFLPPLPPNAHYKIYPFSAISGPYGKENTFGIKPQANNNKSVAIPLTIEYIQTV